MIDGYLGNSKLKKPGIEIEYSQEQLIEITDCQRRQGFDFI